MALHEQIAVAADCEIYFCDPHSPWQRPSQREHQRAAAPDFPKGTDLSVHSPQHLAGYSGRAERPAAQGAGRKTPAEAMAEFLDSQAA